jgi:hypothetical protein
VAPFSRSGFGGVTARDWGGLLWIYETANAELTKVRQVLLKSQGAFLLKQGPIKHHKDTLGSNYMDPV